jgi:hypothetical protein
MADPTRRGATSPLAALTDVFATLVGFFLFTVVAGVLAPHLPPLATVLALWLVGVPAAFGLSVVAVAAATRLERRARRVACARWRVGCDRDAPDPTV